MNRITILCKKAEKLVDKVVEQGSIDGKTFFTFKNIKNAPLITITTKNGYTYLESCTCQHCSIFGGTTNMKQLCSYVLAVYKYLGK